MHNFLGGDECLVYQACHYFLEVNMCASSSDSSVIDNLVQIDFGGDEEVAGYSEEDSMPRGNIRRRLNVDYDDEESTAALVFYTSSYEAGAL